MKRTAPFATLKSMNVTINGQSRSLEALKPGSSVADLVTALGMQADRVALELNGAIVSRSDWKTVSLGDGDRLEIVHFVGGGS
jgi:sulfur carrier protein